MYVLNKLYVTHILNTLCVYVYVACIYINLRIILGEITIIRVRAKT